VSAVRGSNEGGVGILFDAAGPGRCEWNEGIILRGDEQVRHADVADDTLGAGRFVVFLGILVTETWSGDGVIEFAHGADAAKSIEGIALWKEPDFFGVAGHQSGDEMALIKIVVAALEGIGTSREIEGGADGGNSSQSRWRGCAEFAGHFGDEIAAHGVSREEDLRKAIAAGEFFEHGAIVGAHAGIVKSRRKEFGATAIALVEADGVEAAFEGLFGDAAHVIGIAGAFQTVNEEQ